MKAWYFPAWNRKKNWIMEDFRVEATTIEEARKIVCSTHSVEWIIGDCRHCRLI